MKLKAFVILRALGGFWVLPVQRETESLPVDREYSFCSDEVSDFFREILCIPRFAPFRSPFIRVSLNWPTTR